MAEIRLGVVVPTRNRAELAARTVNSLAGFSKPLTIVVSDNSTDPEEQQRLQRYCSELSSLASIVYVRPPRSLSMSKHWQWAFERTLEIPDITHLFYATDRMLFTNDRLKTIHDLVQRFPESVAMYTADHILDHTMPVQLLQARWSGQLVRLKSEDLLQRTSQLKFHNPYPVPRMMNCVVPVNIFRRISDLFGTVFDSISPDYCFAFRSLAVVDSVLLLDKPLSLLHATFRSNGTAFARGFPSKMDRVDFMKMQEGPYNSRSPVPGLLTITNGILHEYQSVSEGLGNRFPPINMPAYFQRIGSEVAFIEDLSEREEMLNLLTRHGLAKPSQPMLFRMRALLRLPASHVTQPFWRAVARTVRLYPPGDAPLEFSSSESAIQHSQRYPRRRHLWPLHLRLLLGPSFLVVEKEGF